MMDKQQIDVLLGENQELKKTCEKLAAFIRRMALLGEDLDDAVESGQITQEEYEVADMAREVLGEYEKNT